MIRVALAGLGVHGSRYAAHLLRNEVPSMRLAAVCRSDRAAGREFARRHGLRFFADPVEAATLPEIDAVIASLPPDLHPGVVEACVDAGRPVLVEKPLAADLASAARLAAKAAGSDARVMVAHTLRFDPLIEALRRESANLGAIRVVAIGQRLEPEGPRWLRTPGRGGVILNTGVHGFDLLRYLTGAEAVSVLAEAARVGSTRTEDEFAAIVRMEPGGILATVDNARTTAGRSGRIEIAGERGQLWGDHVHRGLFRIEGRRQDDLGRVEAEPTLPQTMRRFASWIRSGGSPPVGVADGLAAVEIADAVARSARSGRRVRPGREAHREKAR